MDDVSNARSISLMILLSILVSYFILSNVMLIGPIYNNLNKLYMSILMGMTMGAIASITMPFENKSYSVVVFGASIVASIILVLMIRRQTFINKTQFTKSMVEHHEMAILMSRQVLKNTMNPAVRELAQNIINSQQKEIDQMISWINQGFPSTSANRQTNNNMSELSDDDFLKHMIEHHQVAIDMSHDILKTTTNPYVNKLAHSIISSQSREISEMQLMLNNRNEFER